MNNRDIIRSKILPDKDVESMLALWKSEDQQVIFTNGCFDIMHMGHVDYLSRAADLGGVLVVGLNSDKSVRSIKGPGRPLQDEASRSFLLASLFFVNAVILFDQDTPVELLNRIKPGILVKGNDYKPEEVVGADIVTSHGGRIMTLDIVKGYSTTSIINKSSR